MVLFNITVQMGDMFTRFPTASVITELCQLSSYAEPFCLRVVYNQV